jgi:hypothetical protein
MDEVKINDFGIILGIGLLGAKFGIFDEAFKSSCTELEFLAKSNINGEYFHKWLDAAIAYDFIRLNEGKIVLTEFGKSFATDADDTQLANLIQGVFTVLIANEAIPLLETGNRPGYELVYRFKNISPWYDYVNQKKNDLLISQIFANELLLNKIKDLRGNIADFGSGNGWLIENIKRHFTGCEFYSVNGRHQMIYGINSISTASFFANEIKYSLIILNKVLHHIWEEQALIKQILNKLSNDGILLIWEFAWSDDIKLLPKFKEIVFLNLIEHIQKASYIEMSEINSYFEKLGFHSSNFKIDNEKQIIYIVQK